MSSEKWEVIPSGTLGAVKPFGHRSAGNGAGRALLSPGTLPGSSQLLPRDFMAGTL